MGLRTNLGFGEYLGSLGLKQHQLHQQQFKLVTTAEPTTIKTATSHAKQITQVIFFGTDI